MILLPEGSKILAVLLFAHMIGIPEHIEKTILVDFSVSMHSSTEMFPHSSLVSLLHYYVLPSAYQNGLSSRSFQSHVLTSFIPVSAK